MSEPSFDPAVVDRIVERVGGTPDRVIPILQALQAEMRWLPEEALRRVCEITEIAPSSLVGVATFYDHFRFRPMGRDVLRVCHGALHVARGAVAHADHVPPHRAVPELPVEGGDAGHGRRVPTRGSRSASWNTILGPSVSRSLR